MHTRIREFALKAAHAYRKKYRCDGKDASQCPDVTDAPAGVALQLSQETHDAFYDAISANPADNAPKLVYADYLDEQGYPGFAQSHRLATQPRMKPASTGGVIANVGGIHPAGNYVFITLRDHSTSYGNPRPTLAEVSGVPGGAYSTTDMDHIRQLMSELRPARPANTGYDQYASPAYNKDRHDQARALLGMPEYTPEQLARPRRHKLDPKITEALGGNATSGFIPTPESSWIRSLRYKPETGVIMRVKKTGKDYPYPGFGLREFKRWLQAVSKGDWWWRNVHDVMKHSTFPQPAQLSRWTGTVHKLMTPAADGPVQWNFMNKVGKEEVMQWMRRHVHPQMNEAHLAALTGWVPGTELTLVHGTRRLNGSSQPTSLTINSESPFSTARTITGRDYSAQRTIHGKYSPSGPHIENEHIIIGKTPGSPFKGLSGPVLLRQMRAAHEIGIPRIGWKAVFSEPHTSNMGFVGGLHWPLMGVDGHLPASHVQSMPPEIHQELSRLTDGRWGHNGQYRVADLSMSQAARDWYVENPVTHDAFVDTRPGSYSRRNVERHVGENAKQFGFAPPTPDHMLRQEPLAEHPTVQPGIGPAGFKIRMQLLLAKQRRRVYHPATEHLIATGNLHPAFFDDYFCH